MQWLTSGLCMYVCIYSFIYLLTRISVRIGFNRVTMPGKLISSLDFSVLLRFFDYRLLLNC